MFQRQKRAIIARKRPRRQTLAYVQRSPSPAGQMIPFPQGFRMRTGIMRSLQ